VRSGEREVKRKGLEGDREEEGRGEGMGMGMPVRASVWWIGAVVEWFVASAHRKKRWNCLKSLHDLKNLEAIRSCASTLETREKGRGRWEGMDRRKET
jgi:hypothetical protein